MTFPNESCKLRRASGQKETGTSAGRLASNFLLFSTAARTASAPNHEALQRDAVLDLDLDLLSDTSAVSRRSIFSSRGHAPCTGRRHTSAFSGQTATSLFSSYRARNHLTLRTRLANKRRARGIERSGIVVERWEVKTEAQRSVAKQLAARQRSRGKTAREGAHAALKGRVARRMSE